MPAKTDVRSTTEIGLSRDVLNWLSTEARYLSFFENQAKEVSREGIGELAVDF